VRGPRSSSCGQQAGSARATDGPVLPAEGYDAIACESASTWRRKASSAARRRRTFSQTWNQVSKLWRETRAPRSQGYPQPSSLPNIVNRRHPWWAPRAEALPDAGSVVHRVIPTCG
jgi:hypothetical protein